MTPFRYGGKVRRFPAISLAIAVTPNLNLAAAPGNVAFAGRGTGLRR